MKKFIVLAVATSLCTAAYAENTTTLYGALAYRTIFQKKHGQKASDNRWNLNQGASRFGIKGDEDLGNGLKAYFKFELNVDGVSAGVNQARYAYIGLGGDWGQVYFGHQDTLFKKATTFNDNFNGVFMGDHMHPGTLTGGGRAAKMISYYSPNFSGFKFYAGGILDGSHDGNMQFTKYKTGKKKPDGSDEIISLTDKKAFIGAQTALTYDINGFHTGLAYSWMNASHTPRSEADSLAYGGKGTFNSRGNTEAVGGEIGYSNDQFRVGLTASHVSSLGEKYNIGGQYYFGPHTITAGFGLGDSKDVNPDGKVYDYALGYKYNLSKRTFAWLEGEYTDWNAKKVKNGYLVELGLRHNF